MSEETELGILTVLVERILSERLPRALDMQKRVENGECLIESDIKFLEKVFSDATKLQKAKLLQHPEYEEIASKMAHLYKTITEKALENEKNRK